MKVLFIDTVHPILQEELEKHNYTCIDGTTWSREKILVQIHEIEGVVIRSKFTINKEFLDTAKQLKFIARSGAGLENIDIELAEEKGVYIYNSPEGNRDAVGEQAVGMLLSLFNNLNNADREVRNGIWEREGNRGHEIKGKTIGIIGYGNMGRAFAQRLSGFECKVLAYDKYKTDYSDEFANASTLNNIFEEADILSIHTPLTHETEFLINKEFIQQFKKPIYVINTARGKVLKTLDLVEALKSGKIKGACLDVLEFENSSFEKISLTNKLPESLEYLINSENVILSPHIAGWTFESYVKLSSYLAEKIIHQFGTIPNG